MSVKQPLETTREFMPLNVSISWKKILQNCPEPYFFLLHTLNIGIFVPAAAAKCPDRVKIMGQLPDIALSWLNKIIESLLACDVTDYAAEYITLVYKSNSFEEFTVHVCDLFVTAIWG